MNLPERRILTVSALTQTVKLLMEASFPFVWVEGEISNFRTISSGTSYFTLKDENAQIRAVLFKVNRRYLRFHPEDGMHIVCQGRISVYEARGEYQLIIDHMEPRGIGALQKAFLQLREKLQKEGLFDAERKKRLPLLPKKIGVVSSMTGAALYDFLRTAANRCPNLHIVIAPARVQGEGSAQEMAGAISDLNLVEGVEVIVLTRGGGSFEDLWAFNEESLARAVFASRIPVVSAVGHEVDFTITDFVADARVATPTAAAELVVAGKADFEEEINGLRDRLGKAAGREYAFLKERLAHFITRLTGVKHKVEDGRLHIEAVQLEMRHNLMLRLQNLRRPLNQLALVLNEHHPGKRIAAANYQIGLLRGELELRIQGHFGNKRGAIAELKTRLDGVNPLSILGRGYSITRLLPGGEILKNTQGLKPGSEVKIRLYRGELLCRVERVEDAE
ncbi:MAG: exodeoxyribonuclease VII large subunit [Pseudomonadota bacterium]